MADFCPMLSMMLRKIQFFQSSTCDVHQVSSLYTAGVLAQWVSPAEMRHVQPN
jgi:hypothetical protein